MRIDGIPAGITFALAGLGLFLVAIKLMSNSLKTMTGGFTTKLIKKFSTNRWIALGFGIMFTTMIQSSDGAVALTIGLIAAGFMTLRGAIPFILGANIGTATTSLIVYLGSGFSFTQYITILIFIGGLAYLIVKEEKKSNIALLIFAFGSIFLGLKVLSAGMKTISATSQFRDIVHGAAFNPWIAMLSSLGLTGLMQSSSATVTVVQSLYGGGANAAAMSLSAGIAMIIGANIGTTFTGLIASIGGPKDTRRISFTWLITNAIMAILMLPLINYYADFIGLMVGDTNSDTRRLQLAVSHLLFNGALVFIFIWLVDPLAKISRLAIKDDPNKIPYTLHLPEQLIYESPALAYQAAAQASSDIAKMTQDGARLATSWIKHKDKNSRKYFNELNGVIDRYKKNLYVYLVKLGSAEITQNLSSKHMSLVLATRSLDKMSSLIKVALMELDVQIKTTNEFQKEIDEIESILKIIISELKRLTSLLVKWKTKDAKEIKTLNELLEQKADEFEKNFIKRNKKNQHTFDYISALRSLRRVSHHAARVVNYVSRGRKVHAIKEVSNELLLEIKESIA